MSRETRSKGYIWNTVAGLVNASEAVLMSIVVMRFSSIDNAGVLSIAFAVGNLLMTIGKFGVRYYQITDQKDEIHFSTYFILRIVTVLIMLLGGIGYIGYGVVYSSYTTNKSITVFCILIIYAYEAFEDLYAGRFQQLDRIDVGAKIFTFRWIATLGVFSGVLMISRDFLVAIISGSITALVVGSVFLFVYKRGFNCSLKEIKKSKMRILVLSCYPLFCTSFLSYYMTNAPKYLIDRYLNDEEQACFGFIFMPVFVIELLNNFLYQPIIVEMTREWNDSNFVSFTKKMKRQIILIVLLSLGVLLGGYVLGIPILSIIYNTKLDAYRMHLMLLLLGGGMLAFQAYFSVVLTILRKQQWVLYIMSGFAIVTFLFLGRVVQEDGLMGASVFFTVVNAVLALFLGIVIGVYIKWKKKTTR